MELREYQQSIVSDIYAAWAQGHQNVLVELATGGGKTAIFSYILSKHQDYSIAIAHRIELVSQISLTLARYGVYHNIIAQNTSIREIVSLHMSELGRSYYSQHSKCCVAAVDTLLRLHPETIWFKRISLVVQDEGHHPLRENKWGAAAALFPKARGLYPTATPTRADGKGLGRDSDGIMDVMISGISMRKLIQLGYLTDYKIIAPKNLVQLSEVPVGKTGDFSQPKLRQAVHSSRITGSVVEHYLKFAKGKLGVTFAVDIKSAEELAIEFKNRGVPAEVITGETPLLLRSRIMRDFRDRKILQLVNVDILGEGVDVPAIEVISMARPTQSFSLFSQQFGRALRPMQGKTHAIIIDHVDNILRHGLPDAPRVWTLDRREKRSTGTRNDVIPLRTCLNEDCLGVYPRTTRTCPYCGFYSQPIDRTSIESVDGDLCELDPEVLKRMRGEIERIDNPLRIPQHLEVIAQLGLANRHAERQESQQLLRSSIAQWAGYMKQASKEDSEIYSLFWFKFGTDIMTAQTLGSRQALELRDRIDRNTDEIAAKGIYE